MQDTSNKNSKKIAPIVCAAIFIALLAIYFGIVFFPIIGVGMSDGVAIAVLIIYGLIVLAVIGGILMALFQRLHEIEGGEEDDAKKY